MEKPSSTTDAGAALFAGIMFLASGLWLLVADAAAHHLIDGIAAVALMLIIIAGVFLGMAALPKRTTPPTTKE